MKKKYSAVILFSLILLGGCAANPLVNISPNLNRNNPGIFAILPFSHSNSQENSRASDIVTDSFETAFISTGYRVVERSKLNKVLDEIKSSYNGVFDEDNLKEIGKMTNADIVVFGMIREVATYVKEPEQCTKISYSFKAIHIETGEIIIKGSISKEAGLVTIDITSLPSLCSIGMPEFSDKVSKQFVDKLLKELKGEK